MHVTQVHGAATGDHDFLAWQDEPETGDRFQNLERRQCWILLERRSRNRIQDIDRHDVCPDLPQGKSQIAPVLARLAHADDAAGTNLDAGLF